MKYLILLTLLITNSFAVEITVIEFTNDYLMNQYISIFAYMTGFLCAFFGAFSLMSR